MNRKRKLTAIIVMVLCLGVLGGCAKKDEEQMDAQMKSSFAQGTAQIVQQLDKFSAAEIEYQIADFEDSGITDMAAALENWLSTKEEVGALVSVDTENAQVEFKNNQYTVTLDATYEKRPMEITIIYDKKGMTSNMEFSPVYAMSENMEKAAIHTLIGMGTVFIVLIFISVVIGCFKYINEWEKKAAAKDVPAVPAPAPAPAPVVPAASAEEVVEDVTDDLELVAVITAAIAASLDTPADGLVVRSIRRKPGSKWKRA